MLHIGESAYLIAHAITAANPMPDKEILNDWKKVGKKSFISKPLGMMIKKIAIKIHVNLFLLIIDSNSFG